MTEIEHLTPAQAPAVSAGARVAVRTCMGVGARDRVVIITDHATHAIGRALAEESAEAGGEAACWDLEQYGSRPVLALPNALRADLRASMPTVTFFAASSQPGEVTFRSALRRHLLNDLGVRHAHMPNITPRLMAEGMLSDYRTVAALTIAVSDLVRVAETIRVTTPDGTDLTASIDPALRWIPCTGIYHAAGEWGNLPEGETYTCPRAVEGRVVAHVIGDYFSEKYGVLEHPVVFVIRDGRAAEVRSENRTLAAELTRYLDSDDNGRRVGEFAIGTNIGLTALSGNLLQDEKLPGIHVAFGDPYPEQTGANWRSAVHVDVVPTNCTIVVDGKMLMQDGRFDCDLLGVPEAVRRALP